VEKDVEKILTGFYDAKKPISACCISPILLAKVFGTSNLGPGIKITLGDEGEVIIILYKIYLGCMALFRNN
jgi:enhancing lycopene biosynthesis protein 2